MKRTILVFVGTRPEAVKMAPVVSALREYLEDFRVVLASTGQHREMLAQTLADFDLAPDINLNVMTEGQTLAGLSSRLFAQIDPVLEAEKSDMVMVQGDTTTVMVAALCAFYRGIPCGHVEAGLRSGDMHAPFPEELNRRIAAMASSVHFAPTKRAVSALVAEGVSEANIHLTGNTAIDALLWTVRDIAIRPPSLPEDVRAILGSKKRFVLVTGHRRENFGIGFENICLALNALAMQYPDVYFLYPMHRNPNVRNVVTRLLAGRNNIILTAPLPYRQFVAVMQAAYCLLTDSGGIQEEAPSLKKPVLVMREVTERPESVEAGCSRLVGTDAQAIIHGIAELIEDQSVYKQMQNVCNPYGDGQAAKRIATAVRVYFGLERKSSCA